MISAMGRLVILAVAFMGLLLLNADAQPERRVALVIGNGTYAEAGTLTNPVNDALDIAGKLRSIGFDVIEGNDLGKRELERKIGEFSDALQGAGVGLFYYAGHGLQVEGRNYIVPVDARLDMPVKLQLEAVPIDEVLDIMEQQTKVSLVFLDACRNNPFARSLSRTATTRSATALAGLAQFDSTRGSFIAFSTAPGAVAMDGTGAQFAVCRRIAAAHGRTRPEHQRHDDRGAPRRGFRNPRGTAPLGTGFAARAV